MYYVILGLIVLAVGWQIFKVAQKKWREADVEEARRKATTTAAVYKEAQDINPDVVKEQQKKIDEVTNLKD